MCETDIVINDLHWQVFKEREDFLFIGVRDIHGETTLQHILDVKIIVSFDGSDLKLVDGFNHLIQMAVLHGIKQITQMDKTACCIAAAQAGDARLHGCMIIV